MHVKLYKLEFYHLWNVSKRLSIFQTSMFIINEISTQSVAIS
jgi:hypothetical protein